MSAENEITSDSRSAPGQRKFVPGLLAITIVVVMVAYLRNQGQPWWCDCGSFSLWSGNTWSPHNSQHLFDPYSFAHVLHGLLFYGFLRMFFPRLSLSWRLCFAILFEAGWEGFENSEFVINRYRTATISLDYTGDAVLNSVGDIISCIAGFFIARRLGFWGSTALFVLIEIALLMAIRDSLMLNVLMLVYPLNVVKEWQTPI